MAKKATMVDGKVKVKYGHLYYVSRGGVVMETKMKWNKKR